MAGSVVGERRDSPCGSVIWLTSPELLYANVVRSPVAVSVMVVSWPPV